MLEPKPIPAGNNQSQTPGRTVDRSWGDNLPDLLSSRPVEASDTPGLKEIFVSNKRIELGWKDINDPPTFRMLLEAQWLAFEARLRSPGFLTTDLAIDFDKALIGRLAYRDSGSTRHIVCLEIHPDWQGRGMGTRIIQTLCGLAAATETSLGLRVRKNNPATRLYSRLGFRITSDLNTEFLMTLQPARG